LETGRLSAFDTVDGYRIARQHYELGEVELEPDEAAAVALAARLWDSPELAGAAHGALVKLRAAGVDVEEESPGPAIEPRVRAAEPAFGPLLAAVQAGRVVTFAHRRHPTAEPAKRTVEPWGVVGWRGRWYLVGHDRDRADTRCFRLSRILAPVVAIGPAGAVQVPEGTDAMSIVRDSFGALPPVIGTAVVWVAAGRANGLRRLGRPVGVAEHNGRPGDLFELELRSTETVARWVAGHGPDVAVLEPPELAAAVRRCWEGAARAHPAAVATP
jgi:proteasome accessory factor B